MIINQKKITAIYEALTNAKGYEVCSAISRLDLPLIAILYQFISEILPQRILTLHKNPIDHLYLCEEEA